MITVVLFILDAGVCKRKYQSTTGGEPMSGKSKRGRNHKMMSLITGRCKMGPICVFGAPACLTPVSPILVYIEY
jgi:hypothetical protein